jgi:hypothetical protein
MNAVLFVAIMATVMAVGAHAQFFPPENNISKCEDPSIQNKDLFYTQLEASTQMPAQVFALRVGVPFGTLSTFFNQPQYWTVWNHLFAYNYVTNYTLCAGFNNVSYTTAPQVDPPFPANLKGPHWIDQHGYNAKGDEFAFGWIFRLTVDGDMIVFGRHTFTIRKYVDQSGVDAAIVESFEKAAGKQLDSRVNQYAWTVALEESLIDSVKGFVCLERVYKATGTLEIDAVRAGCLVFKP